MLLRRIGQPSGVNASERADWSVGVALVGGAVVTVAAERGLSDGKIGDRAIEVVSQ